VFCDFGHSALQVRFAPKGLSCLGLSCPVRWGPHLLMHVLSSRPLSSALPL
jgi:hypothetical protein